MSTSSEFLRETPLKLEPGVSKTLRIRVRPRSETPATGKGALEIRFKDKTGKPQAIKTELKGDGTIDEISIGEDGFGSKSELNSGEYTLILKGEKPQNPLKFDKRIYFESGSSRVGREADTTIDELFEYLESNKQNDVVLIECQGFADSPGKKVFNMKLSQKRARAVNDVLRSRLNNVKNLANIKLAPPLGKGELDGRGREFRRVEFHFKRGEVRLGASTPIADPVDANKPRILLLGDSWAENMWKRSRKTLNYKIPYIDVKTPFTYRVEASPFLDAMGANGLSKDLVAGELSALGATLAKNWVKPAPNPKGDYHSLLGNLRTFRNGNFGSIAHVHKHQNLASLGLIQKTLLHFKNIDVIHLSLGGNDIFDVMSNDHRVKTWGKILYSDPNVSSEYLAKFAAILGGKSGPVSETVAREKLPEYLGRSGWKRNDLSQEETTKLESTRNEFINDIDNVLRPIIQNLETILDFIFEKINPDIQICMVGYTQLFLNVRGARHGKLEAIKQEILENKNPEYYYSGPVGTGMIFFNQVVLAAFERLRIKLLDKYNAGGRNRLYFQCFFFKPEDCSLDPVNVSKYYQDDKYRTEEYHVKLKKLLTEDGFHLFNAGYNSMADFLIKKYYKSWVKAATRRGK